MDKRRRKDIRGILADPDLRRELMVPTIQATQAREGIETTRKQAERAYYVVTEGDRAAFFSLKQFKGTKGQPDSRHEMFVRALTDAETNFRFDVARRDFETIESAPLAFSRVGLVSHIFKEAPALDPAWATAAQGLATGADERFVRQHWEILPDIVGKQKIWVPFAKGGEFCRFYSDVHLVVNWTPNAIEDMEAIGRVQNVSYYFEPGLTWPYRTQRGFSPRLKPMGSIHGHVGHSMFPSREYDTLFLLGVLASSIFEFILGLFSAFGKYEIGMLKRCPVPKAAIKQHAAISERSRSIYDAKASWDEGNEISTSFRLPWLLNEKFIVGVVDLSVLSRLNEIADYEAMKETWIQKIYIELDEEVYKLYGISDSTRAIVKETLGERPPEILWPQMEGKSVEQKRMEHVFRLLSYLVRRAVKANADGIVPFVGRSGEPSLLERVQKELQTLFPKHEIGRIEAEIANELKKNVKGYRRTNGIGEWLENVFFDYHCALYKRRPIIWHLASSQGTARFAFGALCLYHKFDHNRMAKLRGLYVKDAIDECRREAALAANDGRNDDRLEWQARLEEVQEFDRRLQLIQEGYHEEPEGGEHDYRILTPWKSAEERPKGWAPDLNDGVKVNIEPLQKAGVLRVAKVI